MLSTLDALEESLRARANGARDIYDERGALLLESVLAQVQQVRQAEDSQLVTVAEAARYSGFDEGTITRHVKAGKIANMGENWRTLVRRADLPMKPANERPHLRGIANAPNVPTQREQIARTAITPFRKGAHG
jgi:hypothetical protein